MPSRHVKPARLLQQPASLALPQQTAARPRWPLRPACADHVGLAFQIRDDILDVIGSQEKLGKATGMDEKKNTFVRHYGVARCEAMVENETAQGPARPGLLPGSRGS